MSYSATDGFKNLVQAASLGVTIIATLVSAAAWVVVYYNNREIDGLKLALEKDRLATDLLSESLPFFEKMYSTKSSVASTACHVTAQLALVQSEKTARSEIGVIRGRVLESGYNFDVGLCEQSTETAILSAQVTAKAEELAEKPGTAADGGNIFERAEKAVLDEAKRSAAVDTSHEETSIGRFHAVMASYQLQNCHKAQEAAKLFNDLFKNQLATGGYEVSVFRTTISNHYAVSVDAGDSESSARGLAGFFRAEGREAEERIATGNVEDFDRSNVKFLTGSFVQESKGWLIDSDCLSAQ